MQCFSKTCEAANKRTVVAVVEAVTVVHHGSSCRSSGGASGSCRSDGRQWQQLDVGVLAVAGAAGEPAVEGAVVGSIRLEEQRWVASAVGGAVGHGSGSWRSSKMWQQQLQEQCGQWEHLQEQWHAVAAVGGAVSGHGKS